MNEVLHVALLGVFTIVAVCIALSVAGSIIGERNKVSDNALEGDLGVITDFSVSAGGFGHEDLCPTSFESGAKIVLSGNICKQLQVGKTVIGKKRVSIIPFVSELVNVDYEVK